MALLIDVRLVDGPIRVGATKVRCSRIEIVSEDGEALRCRASVAAPGGSWPPARGGSGPDWDLLLGLGDEHLPGLDGRDAADVAADLAAGRLAALADTSHWYLLRSTAPDGTVTATPWATSAVVGGDEPPAIPPPLRSVVAVMFDEGWEPRRSPAEPTRVVATTQATEDGGELSAWTEPGDPRVVIGVALPPGTPVAAATPDPGGLVTCALQDGTPCVIASAVTTDGVIGREAVGGMIAAVLDAAAAWSAGAP